MKYAAITLAFAATALAASEITDGQVQVPTGAVSQITDGQIQAPTGLASQITDGQIQAPKPTAAVTEITDGQIQAPTAAVTQITDGQIQAPVASSGAPVPSANGTFTTSAPSATPFTGAAGLMSWSKEIVVAAVGAAVGFAML